MLDLDQGMVYLDRAIATEGTFSNFIKATTVSGITHFHEILFKITRKLNQSPFFVGDIEDIALVVDQKEQVEIGLSPFSYESPKVKDPEGHNIGITVSPESHSNIVITVDDESFRVDVDLSKVTIEDAGTHEFEVALSDDGPQPKFDSDYSFIVTIDYIEMPLEELQELQELEELEKSIEQALEGPAPGSGEEAVVLSDEAMAIASLPKIPGESPK